MIKIEQTAPDFTDRGDLFRDIRDSKNKIMRIKPSLLYIFVVFLVAPCIGQEIHFPMPGNSDYPKIRSNGAKLEDFVPAHFDLVSKVRGDLNGDAKPDVALHIKGTFSKFITKLEYGSDFDTNPRILIILLAEKGQRGYRLAVQNNYFVPTPDSPTDAEPFQGMSIRRGVLRLDFELWQSMGSWAATNASYKFQYRNEEFVLIGADREDYMRNSYDSTALSYNFLTGRVKTVDGPRRDLESNPEPIRKKITWSKLRNIKPRALKDLRAAFSWEIEPDIFI